MTHEQVNQHYAEIQALLSERLGAQGRGIIEMSRAVEPLLTRRLAWQIREVGRTRNRVVHEALPAREIPAEFESHCREIVAALQNTPLPAGRAARLPSPNRARRLQSPRPPHGRGSPPLWRRHRAYGAAIGAVAALAFAGVGQAKAPLAILLTLAGGALGFFWLQTLILLAAGGAVIWWRYYSTGAIVLPQP